MTEKEFIKYEHKTLARACHCDILAHKIRNKLQAVYGFVLLQKDAEGEELLEVTEALVRVENHIEELLK